MRRSLWLVFALLAAVAAVAGAQKGKPNEPKRPNLGANADTNDANAYYQWGVARLDTYPRDAAAAFYWATRINPAWAEAFYARWVATHLSDPQRYMYYESGDKATLRSDEIKQIDSLYLRALTLNPYLYQKFKRIMEQHFYMESYRNDIPNVAELDDAVRKAMTSGNSRDASVAAWQRGWIAYTNANFPRALEQFAVALPGWRHKSGLHATRGRIFFMLEAFDSATAELTSAVKEMRKADKDELIVVYESKALYEHSLGMIQEQEGHLDSAREAYGRAVQEDLSYAPAHLKLSELALATGGHGGRAQRDGGGGAGAAGRSGGGVPLWLPLDPGG